MRMVVNENSRSSLLRILYAAAFKFNRSSVATHLTASSGAIFILQIGTLVMSYFEVVKKIEF